MQSEEIEIVVIEDEEDILELLEYHLNKAGYAVTGFLSTDRVEQFLEEETPALMIVDRNLPGVEGSDFVAHLRRLGYDIPVIFLTAKDRESDLERGFRVGGDDYMTKPFSYKELLLRVEALLRRSGVRQSDKIKYRDMVLDPKRHRLTVEGKEIPLSRLEFKLLYTFVTHPNRVLERDFLREEVWKERGDDFHDKTINVALNRLKKKIDPDGTKSYIVPVWGVGYKLA